MSRLTDLIARAKARDSALGEELEREFKALASRRAFGLNFERHRPESVELPGRPVRRGDKVRILPPRGSVQRADQRLWRVKRIDGEGEARMALVELIDAEAPETVEVAVADLVVVAEFRDYIYPGLVSTGRVERGGDKPFHTVINGENFHVLEALTYTHRGKIDAIYIDPPYNTGRAGLEIQQRLCRGGGSISALEMAGVHGATTESCARTTQPGRISSDRHDR